jgi:hypothetical protein
VLGEGLEGAWEKSGGLIGGFTSGNTEEDLLWDFGDLSQVLDGGWSLEDGLDGLGAEDGLDV